jgi:hypothetical protein
MPIKISLGYARLIKWMRDDRVQAKMMSAHGPVVGPVKGCDVYWYEKSERLCGLNDQLSVISSQISSAVLF